MSSSPAIIRSAVDLPQPDGPDEDQELAVGDLEVELLDGLGPVREPLGDLVERDFCHAE